jgi:hypothetical protein
MSKRKIYEIYEGDKLIAKGTRQDLYGVFQIGDWALKTHSKNQTLFKGKYKVLCVGKEGKIERPKPEEEKFDYMPYYLERYGNTIVSKKDYEKNIGRLQEMFNLRVTKVDDYDFGDGGRWRKEGYHYLLEVI